jgi:hypothetical protein
MKPDRAVAVLATALVALLISACGGPSVATQSASPSPSPSKTPAGSIAGRLGYPSNIIPPMTIYAIPLAATGSDVHTVRAVKNQGNYTIKGVEPGSYELFAIPTGDVTSPPPHFMAAYTKAVPCGLAYGCDDHTPIPVTVSADQAVTGIAVTDFYAPQNSFPLLPNGGATVTPLPSPSASYPNAIAAARYEAWRGTRASKVLEGAFDQCPANEACVALGQKHDGTRSAYFDARAGSNADVADCGVYVFQDASGWHPLNTACSYYPAVGKSLSASFLGSGCINVRTNPGYTNKVADCLPVDTTVTIDGGPIFVQETTASDAANLNRLWWHLVGHGWMVHQYLTGMYNVD